MSDILLQDVMHRWDLMECHPRFPYSDAVPWVMPYLFACLAFSFLLAVSCLLPPELPESLKDKLGHNQDSQQPSDNIPPICDKGDNIHSTSIRH